MINFDVLINNYLKRELKQKTIGRYYPSEIGTCLRRVWYSYTIPKETEADLRKVFYVGELIHNFIVEVIKSDKNPAVELKAAEFPFILTIDDFTISGRVDDIILVKIENKTMLVEVKSTSYLDYVEEPKESHVTQLLLYMQALKIYDGFVLYVEKNSLRTKSFNVIYDENLVKWAINRFRLLHQHLLARKPPDPEARIAKSLQWMCAKCPYREECYQTTPKEILP